MAELRISRRAFFHNLDVIVAHAGSKERVAVVLKDNAYGHGIELIAQLAFEYGIKRAFVKNLEEAQVVLPYFEHIGILYADNKTPTNNPKMSIAVNSFEALEALNPSTRIELKINTGLNRNGFAFEQLTEALKRSLERNLEVIGVMSHNGYADALGSEFFIQQQRFQTLKKQTIAWCAEQGIKPPLFHSLNSAGLFRVQAHEDDFVRIGIAQYGYICMNPIFKPPALQPIASLWADKIATQTLKKHERIGYDGVSSMPEDGAVSTYDIGYGDGFFRLNEKHRVFTAEGYAFVPKVSMDCLSVLGDAREVCLFDDARPIAQACDTIPYDVLVKLSRSIPRTITP